MRMDAKVALFGAIYVFGGLAVGIASIETGFGPAPFFAWFAVFGVSQFFILRCPHCGKSATRLRGSSIHVPWAGSACRHCGKPY